MKKWDEKQPNAVYPASVARLRSGVGMFGTHDLNVPKDDYRIPDFPASMLGRWPCGFAVRRTPPRPNPPSRRGIAGHPHM